MKFRTFVVAVIATSITSVYVESKIIYSPYAGEKFPQNVYFGDTYVHTSLSNDAFGAGNRVGPEDAYRFARGEEVTTFHVEPAQLNQPLDFVVIADHVEAYTAFQEIWNFQITECCLIHYLTMPWLSLRYALRMPRSIWG